MPTTQQLNMVPSVVTFASSLTLPPINIEKAITAGRYSRFPGIWQPLSGDPSIQVQVTNNATTAPISPILVDAFTDPVDAVTRYAIFAELSTVMPGQTINEIVAGLPVTQMYLVLYMLSCDTPETSTGFTVQVQAWRV